MALYGAGGKRWSMTERGRRQLHRTRDAIAIGGSAIAWDGTRLRIEIDETTVPVPSRLKGSVTVHPQVLTPFSTALDQAGAHRWGPIAPAARVEVALDHPSLRWAGAGYLDSNDGDAPLEDAFSGWTWSRAALAGGTSVLYDVIGRDGSDRTLALRFARDGTVEPIAPPPVADLPATAWRIRRSTRADPGRGAQVAETLEDGPFYARSLLRTALCGETATAMHESLSLDRFRRLWVRLMLPFRMPRAWS